MSTPAGDVPAVGDATGSEGATVEAVEDLIEEILEADEAAAAADEAEDPVAERDAFLRDLQRVSAEFANFRKQTERRNAEVASRARSGIVDLLLPVLDACDVAVDQGSDDVEPIRAALVSALTPVGLEVIDPVGEAFDPNRHEAVQHEAAGDDADQVVSEVLRRGYSWSGRVLRPAMVRVRG